MHLLTIVLPSALATANRITEPGSATQPTPDMARATMKNYFTHSGKQESREVTITDLDMGTFDYFCNPSIFGKNAGAGQCSKRLASAAEGLPLYLWEKCGGRAVQQKIGERHRWGATPLSLAKLQGQGSAVKKLASATAGGLPLIFGKNAWARQCRKNWPALPLGGYPSIFGKNAGAGQCGKQLERAFGKMQGQGSAVKNWRALPLGATLYLWENARAGQGSKRLASAAGGLPHYLREKCRGRAVPPKLASAAGGLPLYLAGAGQCIKNLASATAGGRPLYLWEKHGSPNCET